jgi:hypothetical protein
VEEAILRSEHAPIETDEWAEMSALGQRGVWLNKREAEEWRGEVPLSQYAINQDGCPLIVNKRTGQCVE